MVIARFARKLVVIAATASLAACAAKPPPVAVAPPAPRIIPARPLPPSGAVATMAIPAVNALGVRQTVNANLTPAQKTWNLRSALNVAALNCLSERHQPILEAYKSLLKKHSKTLAATNRTLDKEFRQKYGAATYRGVRDAYMTQVYNYFALPPSLPEFCDTALAVSNELLLASPTDLDSFAAQAMPRLEQVFENFFVAFEKYRVDAAAWDAEYGPMAGINAAAAPNPLAPGVWVPATPASPLPVPGAAVPKATPAPTLVVPIP